MIAHAIRRRQAILTGVQWSADASEIAERRRNCDFVCSIICSWARPLRRSRARERQRLPSLSWWRGT